MKRRPGRLWLFFYGRQRRGVPYLLIGVLLAVGGLALLFAGPGGADLSRYATGFFLGLLVFGIGAAIAVLVSRRRR